MAKTPQEQLAAKQQALELSKNQAAAEQALLREELKIREELEGKVISQQEIQEESQKLRLSFLEQQEKLLKDIFTLESQLGNATEETKKEFKEINQELKQGNDLLKEQAENLKKSQDAAGAIGGLMETAVGQLGISVKQSEMWSNSFSKIGGSLGGIVKDLKSGNRSIKDFAKSGAEALGTFFTLSDVMGNIVASSLEVARNMREVKQGLAAAGFTAKKAASMQAGFTKELRLLGITSGEYNQTVGELFSTNAKLGNTLKGNAGLFAKLSKVGVNTGDAVEFLNSRMFELGEKSPKAMEDSLGDLLAIDEKLGNVRGTALKEFTANMQRLNQYGPKSKQVFAELSVVAEETGLSMGKILDVTKQFDTFEGAANLAQKLNVALGTSISSLELVGKTDVERAQIISQRLKESGADFNNISPQLSRVLEQAGMDVGTLRRMAGADLSNVSAEAVKVSNDNTKILAAAAAEVKATLDPLDRAALAVKESFAKLALVVNKHLMPFVEGFADLPSDTILTILTSLGALASLFAATRFGRAMKWLARLFGKGGGAGGAGGAAAGAAKAATGAATDVAAKTATKKGAGWLAKLGGMVGLGGAAAGSTAAIAGKSGAAKLGKGLLKKIPGVGLILGAGFAIDRAMEGDYLGAAGELVAGGLSTIPGIGTAAAIGIEAALMGRDIAYETGALKGSRTSAANQLRDLAVVAATGAGSALGPQGAIAGAALAAKFVPGEDTSGMAAAQTAAADASAGGRSVVVHNHVVAELDGKKMGKAVTSTVRKTMANPAVAARASSI